MKHKAGNRKMTATMVTLAIVIDLLDTTVVTVAIPTLQQEFGSSAGTVQWIVTVYLLGIAFTLPASGWISRRFGPECTFLVALGLFGAASALTATAWSLPAMITFRGLQGLAGGLILPLGMALLFNAFPADQRPKASALISVPASLAPVLGPLIGGWLVQDIGWRWAFWLNVPVAAAAIVLGIRQPEKRAPEGAGRFDALGLLLVSTALLLLIFGLTGAKTGLSVGALVIILGASAAALSVFTVLQLRRKEPLLNLRLLGRREIWSSNAAFLLSSLSYGGLLFLLPLYFRDQRGMAALESSLMTSLHAVGILLATPLTTRYTHAHGPRLPLVTGLALMALGTAGLAFTESAPVWATGGLVLACGFGFGMIIVPLQTATVTGLVDQELSDGSTIVNMGRQVGLSVGVAVAAATLPAITGPDPEHEFAACFLVIGVITALAIAPSAAFRTHRPPLPSPVPNPDQRRIHDEIRSSRVG